MAAPVCGHMAERPGWLEAQVAWIQILTPVHTSCLTFSTYLNLCVPTSSVKRG